MKVKFKKSLSLLMAIILVVSLFVICPVTASAEGKTTVYQDFIKGRGQNLQNTYAKLSKGEDLNVLYFGGSVTDGSDIGGVPPIYCWRERVGDWLIEQFPESTINNFNVAYGGTGTKFGAYRLREEVLSKNPDLIFIEFSINDGYDSTSVADSSLYFETIVYQLRAEFPKCDIITLYIEDRQTINVSTINSRAQEHEKICVQYDIPSIHVGRAMAHHLIYNDSFSNWNNYYFDSVHPISEGYEIYFNPIKEYMSNELLYGGYDGTAKDHTIPRLINEVLVDGNMQYFDASEEMVNKSNQLGGSGFIYSETASKLEYSFEGGLTAIGANPSVALEFEGTELVMVVGSDGSGTTVESMVVTIDDNRPRIVPYSSVKPIILVSGLTPGEHVAKILFNFKNGATSGSIWISGFLTRDDTKATCKYDHREHIFENYISNNDATCAVGGDGTKTAKCKYAGCDKTDTVVDVGSKKSHEYKVDIINKATLTENGYGELICIGCDRWDGYVDFNAVNNIYLSKTAYTYDGTVKKPSVIVKDSTGKSLTLNKDYTVVYPQGMKNIGTYTVKVNLKGNYSGSKSLTYKINAINASSCSAKLSTTTYTYNGSNKTPTVTVKDTAGKTLKKDVDYTVTYPKYRRVAGKHKVIVKFKGKYSGTKNLYFTIKPLKLSKFTAKLSTTKYTYNGKAKTPAVTVKTTGGKTLKKNVDYTVTYPKYRKNVGKYKVVIKLKGNYSGSKALYFTVNPAKTSVKKLTAAKKSLKVAITKKSTQVTGYQVQYSTSKSFKSAKTKTVKSYKTTSVTLKSLKAKKTYYVRVRTFKKVGKTTYYSGWSTYKKKKTKK